VKTCMQRLYVSGIVHYGRRGVVECYPVESEIGGVMGLFVYMTQQGSNSACLPIVIVLF